MLYHHGCDPAHLSDETRELRYSHHITGDCFPTGNVWSWDAEGDMPAGEAVDVVTNPPGTPLRCHVVFRFDGFLPDVIEARGVNGMLKAFGYTPPRLND